jgi:hypothetical protein
MELRLLTSPDTVTMLDELGVQVHVAESKRAAEVYNELTGSHSVGCLIHSTC